MFIQWHRHSEYSRLDGCGTAKQYAERAVELDMPALALTDHGTISGALHHVRACRDAKIVPIVGVEAYYRPDRSKRETREAWHLCLFALNLTGWHNLLRITSKAFQEQTEGGGFYQYPCVDLPLMRKYNEGIFCSTACFQGWLAENIRNGDSVAVDDWIVQLKDCYRDRLAVEIMPHDFDDQRMLNPIMADVAHEHSVMLWATNDAHVPYKSWTKTQKVAKIISVRSSIEKQKTELEKWHELKVDHDKATAIYEEALAEYEAKKEAGKRAAKPKPPKKLKKEPHFTDEVSTVYMMSEEEMARAFEKYHPDMEESVWRQALDNTGLVLPMVKPFILDRSDKLPDVKGKFGDTKKLLRKWIEEGFQELIDEWEDSDRSDEEIDELIATYRDQIEREFMVVEAKGVIDYTVLVGDFVRWMRANNIVVGHGRGSAAGSIISFLVKITAIDPIAYGLKFERYLNPERKGLPDIDIDIDSDTRARAKRYLGNTYGQENVADIITHATFAPVKCLLDVSKAMDVEFTKYRAVADTIEIRPDDEEQTLEEIRTINPDLDNYAKEEPEVWEIMLHLEGTVANAGKHAGGVIITPMPIVEKMGLERGKKGDLVTSWSDKPMSGKSDVPTAISDYGFVKIDALGITGLSKHRYALDLIEKRTGHRPDLNKLPALRDPSAVDEYVMEGFRLGLTVGVFQFGASGATKLLKAVKPDTINDLAAVNALNRPGPLGGGVAWKYPKLKHGEEEPEYVHPILEEILGETYGVIAFQEQVMEIAQRIGGFTGAQADDLRKAMGKLYRLPGDEAQKFMQGYYSQWERGAKARGLTKSEYDAVWELILAFGNYGFNKSHSASYALQAYQDMFLKRRYPLEFYAALLTYSKSKDLKMRAIREARASGLEVLPPDVRYSKLGWTVTDERLIMGLTQIDGVGDVAAKDIEENQPYKSYEDFCARTSGQKCKVDVREALKESGAFDWAGVRDELSGAKLIELDKARLGISLRVSDETTKYAEILHESVYTQDEVESDDLADGDDIIIGGEVTDFNRKTAKNGRPFANAKIVFEMNEWSVKLWEDKLNRYGHMFEIGNTVIVNGSKNVWNDNVQVVLEAAAPLAEYAEQFKKQAA